MHHLKGLYAVADVESIGISNIKQAVQLIVQAGIKIVQYRDKNNSTSTRLKCAEELKSITSEQSCMLIINDDVQLAKIINAEGVHLGTDDCSIKEARSILGDNKIIGASCYNIFDKAKIAERNGADYVAFGSFFPSPTKPNAAKADIDLIVRAKKELSIPVCAIGGITKNNIAQVLDAGVDMVAMISALFNTQDPKDMAVDYLELINKFDLPA